MRKLEAQLARLEERLIAFEDYMKKNMVTKNDISNLKVWILGAVLGGILVTAVIGATVVKVFF